MSRRITITEQIPFPARTVLSVVQAAERLKRKEALALIHDGAVEVNGRMVTQSHTRLEIGDCVEILPAATPPPTLGQATHSRASRRFAILYEDPDVVVVDKPAGLLTVPTPNRERNTLLGQLERWASHGRPRSRIICVQRLDRDVSGVLIFARHQQAADLLREQFASHLPRRRYAAIVKGNLDRTQMTIRSRMRTDRRTLHRYSSDTPGGELAITHVRVTERLADATVLAIELETGRRNQIRVHLAEAGHPILGDRRYGQPRGGGDSRWPWKRIALHAEFLGVEHPGTGEPLEFTSPWPVEFKDFRRLALQS
ncbi:MAG: RluA family pseudouridine synthase [Planctomycetota bacterium]|nr:MAG: RluA family pseudouridine synthase [Planctomycetota bacterium]